MWEGHLGQLHRIITARMETIGHEQKPYVVWWAVMLDTYASLTAGGNGELVNMFADCDYLMPRWELLAEPLRGCESDGVVETFILVHNLAQKIVFCAGRIGRLSHRMRANRDADSTKDLYSHNICYTNLYEIRESWVREQPVIEKYVNGLILREPNSQVLPIINETYKHVSEFHRQPSGRPRH